MPVAAQEPARPQLALMGTVPIYWGEAEGLEGLLDTSESGHWARPVLEREFELVPIDYLSADALAPHSTLMMAQPRALSAEENVALDAWVRDGGNLLLFADPMMTGHSHYGLGDRRRPQDVALLSPILAHWGLELHFNEDQPAGLQMLEIDNAQVPVNLPGLFVLRDPEAGCNVTQESVQALCLIGEGTALLYADAAMLDFDGPHPGAETMLADLAGAMAAGFGEITGKPAPDYRTGSRTGGQRYSADGQRGASLPDTTP
ncbi:GldG family protein [Altererythrobacter sp. KTW20L]|uniref:GldG family protein n=1 Tax=Altererythrobacter sp. KTW20L TaxID=2942210 RepID=UPI0020C0CA27|nr:GldG family protein [Altererythrobacter sp. KTW20L]MCL6252163.1 GldG family protein [Altererythrobacter sp. KTW20L]